MPRASVTRPVAMWSAIDQPTIRRRAQVHDAGQVQPPLARGDVGDVDHPLAVGHGRVELPVQHVAGHRPAVVAVGRPGHERPLGLGPQPPLPASGRPPCSRWPTTPSASQGTVDAGAAVHAPVGREHAGDVGRQRRPPGRPGAGRPRGPGVVPRAADGQHAAADADRERGRQVRL